MALSFREEGLTMDGVRAMTFDELASALVRDDVKRSASAFLSAVGAEMKPEIFLSAFVVYQDEAIASRDLYIQSKLLLRTVEEHARSSSPDATRRTVRAVLLRYRSLVERWRTDDRTRTIKEMNECYNGLLDYRRYVVERYDGEDKEEYLRSVEKEVSEYLEAARRMGFTYAMRDEVESDVDRVVAEVVRSNLHQAYWDVVRDDLRTLYRPFYPTEDRTEGEPNGLDGDHVTTQEYTKESTQESTKESTQETAKEPAEHAKPGSAVLRVLGDLKDMFKDVAVHHVDVDREMALFDEAVDVSHFENLIERQVFDRDVLGKVIGFFVSKTVEYSSPFRDEKEVKAALDLATSNLFSVTGNGASDNGETDGGLERFVVGLADIVRDIVERVADVRERWATLERDHEK